MGHQHGGDPIANARRLGAEATLSRLNDNRRSSMRVPADEKINTSSLETLEGELSISSRADSGEIWRFGCGMRGPNYRTNGRVMQSSSGTRDDRPAAAAGPGSGDDSAAQQQQAGSYCSDYPLRGYSSRYSTVRRSVRWVPYSQQGAEGALRGQSSQSKAGCPIPAGL